MRRLARWTLNALTALSLLMFTATVVLWVRSAWKTDGWIETLGDGPSRYVGERSLELGRGAVIIADSRLEHPVPASDPIPAAASHVADAPPGAVQYSWISNLRPVGEPVQVAGIRFERKQGLRWISDTGWLDPHNRKFEISGLGMDPVVTVRCLAVPYGTISLASFVVTLPGLAAGWRRHRRRRLTRAGHCPGCGYDMRATPVKCPECGRSVDCQAAAV